MRLWPFAGRRQPETPAKESVPHPLFWKHIREIAARAKQKPAGVAADKIFAPYQPLKGAVPSGQKIAMDESLGAINWAASTYFNGIAYEEGQVFLGFPELARMAVRPEFRLITETIATEMTRKWIRIKAKANTDKKDKKNQRTDWIGNPLEEEDEGKADKIARIEDEFERLRARDIFRELAVHDGFYGRGHLYLDTGDGHNPDELMTDLGNGRNAVSRTKVNQEHRLKRLATVEPMWTYPVTYNASNPLDPDWYRPSIWYAMGQRVHRTRLIPFVSREVPDLLKPAYAFAGLSLSQMAKPYVDNWLTTRQSVQDIIKSFTVFVLKTNMESTMAGLGTGNAVADAFVARLDTFNDFRDNRGLMAIDKDQEDFQNISAPLGSLDHLQAQAQEHMASVSRIPLVKLTGISPSGLNASSEGELRCFEDLIHSEQESLFGGPLTTLLDFVQLSLFGEVDPEIVYEFLPINELTEKEKAELRQIEAQTGSVLIETGVISQEEERKRVASEPDTPYAGLDPDEMPDLGTEEEMGLGGEQPQHKGFGLGGLGGIKTEGGFKPVTKDQALALDKEFREQDVKRDADGQFAEWAGGGKGKASPKNAKQPKTPAATRAKPAKSPKPKTSKPAGETREIVTPDGKMKLQVQPELVELSSLTHAKGDLQPRNRDTAESRITARERAANLDPEQLQPGRVSDAGAPIIDESGRIISGNGRTMSLREVYDDPAFRAKAEAYRDSLGEAAKGMKQPVLVMRLPKGMSHEELVEFADRSNRSRIESMSATERARRDAKAATPAVMALYRGGDFTSAENKPFMHAFTSKAMSANERAQFSKQGALTKEGADRLSAAVLASAYDDVDALSIMLESTDDNVRSITNAMRDTAGRFVELKSDVKNGYVKPDMDVTPQIADAAKLVSSLRKRGISPSSHFSQIDAFSGLDPIVERLVKAFYNESMSRAKSGKRIENILRFIADEGLKHKSGGFLPDETGPKDVIESAERREAKEHGEGQVFERGFDLTGGKAHGGQGARKGGGGRGRGKRSS